MQTAQLPVAYTAHLPAVINDFSAYDTADDAFDNEIQRLLSGVSDEDLDEVFASGILIY
jgi:hypothetical protein